MDSLTFLFYSDSDLSNFFLDEFAFNLLALCCCREMYPAQILQIALDLFSTLFATIGSNLKILVESFCVQIYLKAILQLIDRLQVTFLNS